MRLNYAIVFVGDMKGSVAFYCDVMGIPLRFESPGWTEFATEGATLALHASTGKSSEMSGLEPAGRCRPGFSVANLDEIHQSMIDHKARCIQELKSVFGVRIAQYSDPDGLIISVSENKRAQS